MNENERCENCAFCVPMPLGEFMCDNENGAAHGVSIEPNDYCEGFEDFRGHCED